MIKNILYVLGVGYMGGSISAMGKYASYLFPYDITKPPYSGKVSDGKDADLLEYLWPMKSVGFPYNLKLGDGYASQYMLWLIDTCRHTFAIIRNFYNVYSNVGDRIATNTLFGIPFGDMFQFYLLPYLLILMMPSIPVLVFFLTLFVSAQYASDGYGYMFTFAPITGWFYGLSECGKTLSITCVLIAWLIGMAGMMTPMISIPSFLMITMAVTLYSYVILFLSPLLYSSGVTNTFQEMRKHKTSLVLLFMYCTLTSASQYLTPPVTIGLTLGALYMLYGLLLG
jgi:hypothetical protein